MTRAVGDPSTLLAEAAEHAVELAVLGGREGRRAFIERVGHFGPRLADACKYDLRWIDARCTGAPHTWHCVTGSSVIFCITSKRCPFSQRYS